MLVISNGFLDVRINDKLGAEVEFIGTEGKNYLAFYDWKTPTRYSSSHSYGDPLLDFMSDYRGGWQTLFPNAGNSAEINGVPLPFHGEFSRTQVQVLKHDKNSLTVQAGSRLSLVLTKTYRLIENESILSIEQEVHNESQIEMPFIWGEHPAFALPAGSKIQMPQGQVHVEEIENGIFSDLVAGSSGTWPTINNKKNNLTDLSIIPSNPTERLCYLNDRSEGWVAMTHNSELIGLSWDLEAFPHLWFWQQIGGPSFPWYGRADITAIEPASTWPSYGLNKAIERNQAFNLMPGERKKSWITFSLAGKGSQAIKEVSSIDRLGNFTFTERKI
jgi:galactose mutarotase-like enzyme